MLDAVKNEYNPLAIPTNNFLSPTTTKIQNQKSRPHSHVMQVAGYAISFEELIQRFGARIDNGFDKPSDFSDSISAPENDYDTEGQTFASRDGNGDRYDTRDQDNFRGNRRDDAAPFANEKNYEDRPNGNHRESQSDRNYDNNNNYRGGQDHENAAPEGKVTDNTLNADGSNGKTFESSISKNRLDGVAIKDNGDGSQNPHVNILFGQENEVIAQHLIGSENASTLSAALYGYNKGLEHLDKIQNFSQTKNTNEFASLTTNNSNRNFLNQSAQNAAQMAQGDLAANAMIQNKEGTHSQPQIMNNLQRQAMQLSQAIGADNRMKVDINVSNETSNISSRPLSTMANASIFTQEGGTNGQMNQPGQHQPNTNMASALQAQAQNVGSLSNVNTGSFKPQTIQSLIQGRTDNLAPGLSNQSNSASANNLSSSDTIQNANQPLSANNQQTTSNREIGHTNVNQSQRTMLQNQNIAEQISVKIQKALQAGNDRINIQLKPAELGKVDVKLELTLDGRVQAIVTADNKDTLDLLRRDASELQRALQDAGFKTNSGDLSFSLRGEQQKQPEENHGRTNRNVNEETELTDNEANDESSDQQIMAAWEAGVLSNNRVDVRV